MTTFSHYIYHLAWFALDEMSLIACENFPFLCIITPRYLNSVTFSNISLSKVKVGIFGLPLQMVKHFVFGLLTIKLHFYSTSKVCSVLLAILL